MGGRRPPYLKVFICSSGSMCCVRRVEVLVQDCDEPYPIGPRSGHPTHKCASKLTFHGTVSGYQMVCGYLSRDEVRAEFHVVHPVIAGWIARYEA